MTPHRSIIDPTVFLSIPVILLTTACHSTAAVAPTGPTAAVAGDAGAVTAVAPRTLNSAPPAGVLDLHVGDSVQGRLENGDQVLVDQSLGDDYTLNLTEGQAVTLVARAGVSTDTDGGLLDPQLILLYNDREVASDDDGARDGTAGNSRIVFSPPVSGLYVLRVTTSGGGVHHGAYVVQTYPGGLLRQR